MVPEIIISGIVFAHDRILPQKGGILLVIAVHGQTEMVARRPEAAFGVLLQLAAVLFIGKSGFRRHVENQHAARLQRGECFGQQQPPVGWRKYPEIAVDHGNHVLIPGEIPLQIIAADIIDFR
ncbi:hypothetical protein SDC9_210837 [bioreactor metagenome]|uniref:Uncharacterized protein n=1 Tax=bioreactor metagenome TaxID=1076179 RepID=A0A645JV15_9ZZZZ